jgi:hypothetical protein
MIEIIIYILILFLIGFLSGYHDGLLIFFWVSSIILVIINGYNGKYDSGTDIWSMYSLFLIIIGCVPYFIGFFLGKSMRKRQ